MVAIASCSSVWVRSVHVLTAWGFATCADMWPTHVSTAYVYTQKIKPDVDLWVCSIMHVQTCEWTDAPLTTCIEQVITSAVRVIIMTPTKNQQLDFVRQLQLCKGCTHG